MTFCLTSDSLRAAMSQFSTMTTREKKIQAAAICREIQGQEGRSNISSSFPFSCCILTLLLFSSHLLCLLLTSCSFHPVAFPFYHTYKHRRGLNTITYGAHLVLRHINFNLNSSSLWLTHTCTGHFHIHFIEGMNPPFAAVANPAFHEPDYK